MQKEQDKSYYVYILCREDEMTPFYVGYGKGSRWTAHERRAKPGGTHKDNIIWGMKSRGIKVPKFKVAEGLTKEVAIAMEIEIIALIGREPNGPLANICSGGEGAPDLPPETRARMTEMQKLRYQDPAVRAAHGEAIKQGWATPGSKEYQSERAKRQMADPESRRRLSEQAKKMWADPETRDRMLSARWTDEQRKANAERLRRLSETISLSTREKMSIARKRYAAIPENSKAYGEAISKALSTPEIRSKLSESARNRWNARPKEEQAAIAEKMRRMHTDPEIKRKSIESKKKIWDDARRERYREIGKKAAQARWGNRKTEVEIACQENDV
jgi:hypothetical protein